MRSRLLAHNTWMAQAGERSRIVIEGGGVAAQCCARLLTARGFVIERHGALRPRLPAIMIGATTQVLFQDAFQAPGLFGGLHQITERVVAWGSGEPRVLPHSAVVADEAALLERLHFDSSAEETLGETAWTIVASRPERDPSTEYAFGERIAFSIAVTLASQSDISACWVEAVEHGWLFLVASAPGSGWLLGVGDTPAALLKESKLVGRQIAETLDSAKHFPAYPRVNWPPCGPQWLACGSLALAFDPLCGDGSGYAIREAILAAAVIQAVENGEDPEALSAHYRTRLLAGFRRHLEVCESFYGTGGLSPWWTAQADSARSGVNWCNAQLKDQPAFKYRLRGFDLERIT